MEKYQIAIMGNHDAVFGFQGLGVAVFSLEADSAAETLRSAVEGGEYAIIFVTEDWIGGLEKVIAEYFDRPLPAIVTVPSPRGSSGASLANLRKIVEQAVGSDILAKD